MAQNWNSGTASIFSETLNYSVSYLVAFHQGEFVLLWDVKEVKLPDSPRLRWQSEDKKQTKYFAVLGVTQCTFPGEHVDLHVKEELNTLQTITERQDEISKKLTELAERGFSDKVPIEPIPLEYLFKHAERQSQRELLRQELGDLAAMVEQVKRT